MQREIWVLLRKSLRFIIPLWTTTQFANNLKVNKLLKRIETQQKYNFMIKTGATGRGDSEFGLITWGSLLPTPEMPPRSQVSVYLFYCSSFAMLRYDDKKGRVWGLEVEDSLNSPRLTCDLYFESELFWLSALYYLSLLLTLCIFLASICSSVQHALDWEAPRPSATQLLQGAYSFLCFFVIIRMW